jgi:hypothetical protein
MTKSGKGAGMAVAKIIIDGGTMKNKPAGKGVMRTFFISVPPGLKFFNQEN